MKPFLALAIVTFCTLLLGCSSPSAVNANNAAAKDAKPSPTTSKEEKDKEDKAYEERVASEQKKALSDFVQTHYRSWTLVGKESGTADCDVGAPCDLHLVNGSRTQVVSVIIRQFEKENGDTYWLVFEARPLDLAMARIEEIKSVEQDATRERVLATLKFEDCETVIEQEREGSYDMRDEYGGSTDPRN